MLRRLVQVGWLACWALLSSGSAAATTHVKLPAWNTPEGYLARLLINEVAFPGERGFHSEQDSIAGMRAVLWVIHCRIHHVPEGYSQREVASVESRNVLEVITANGVKDQMEGFYKDRQGRYRIADRVLKRVEYLTRIANEGQPDKIARMLAEARRLASEYSRSGPGGPDLFEGIRSINGTPVTGRPYSWMADAGRYSPGGSFVRIPRELGGVLGGNRFFTLREDRR